MKIKIWIWLILSGLTMAACFEDESSKDIHLPGSIRINDFSTPRELYVNQGGRLKVTTLSYKEGVDDSNLKFLWTLRGQGRYDTLGNYMILDTTIYVPISREAYSLIYTVTDTVMNLKLSQRYFLYVTGEYEAGLLIADTKDERQSDMHLVVGVNFTQNYNDHSNDHIFRDIYSINNDHKVDGLITGMISLVFSDYLQATIVTENSIQRLNPLENFKVTARNNEMFVKAFTGEMEIGQIDNSDAVTSDVVAVNGHIHKRARYEENTTYGVKMLLEDLTDDYYVTRYKYRPNRNSGNGDIFGVAFDKKHQRFLAFPYARYEDNFRIFRHTSMDGKLDPNKVGNKDCVYIGYGTNSRMYAVLKDNISGKYEIWAFNLNSDDDSQRPDIIPEYYDLSGCPDMANTCAFTSQSMEEVMYYATDDKVYAILLTSEHPQAVPCYEVNPGEKITGIYFTEFCPGKMEIPNPAKPGTTIFSTSRNRMMLVYTYDEGKREGKVIVVPVLSLGTGDLIRDKNFHREYGPFGRILGTTCYHTR